MPTIVGSRASASEDTYAASEKPLRVLIAASGTGGHLFPALYIANALTNEFGATVQFVGSGRPLEEKIVDHAGYKRHVIPIGGLKRLGAMGLLKWVLKLPGAFIKTWRLISTFDPDITVGAGGYVSFLPVLVSKLRGRSTLVHEAEHSPGWTNYVLSLIADKVSTAYPDAHLPKSARTLFTGHPLRPELLTIDFTLDYSNLTPTNIFVTGGSQGATAIDKGMIKIVPFLKTKNFKILHQARADGVELLQKQYIAAGIDAKVVPFIEHIEIAFRDAHVVISRAGAGMCREIGFTGRPAILVPLPKAEEQSLNAESLVPTGRVLVVEEGDGYPERLEAALTQLVSPEFLSTLTPHSVQVGNADAASKIARACVQLIEDRKAH